MSNRMPNGGARAVVKSQLPTTRYGGSSRRAETMRRQPKNENTNRSLEKALQVLLILRESGQGLGITEICQATKFPAGTIFRIVATLRKMNFVTQHTATKKYSLGPAAIRLSTDGLKLTPLKDMAQPILCALRDRTGESSHLYVRRGFYREHVDFVESLQELRVSGRIGDQVPLHAGAASRVLWAFESDDDIKALLNSIDLVPAAANTIVDKEKLIREARKIKKLGYAVSYGERNPSIGSIAAPVFDANGKVVCAVSISMPSVRFNREHIKTFTLDVLWASEVLGASLKKDAGGESGPEGDLPRSR